MTWLGVIFACVCVFRVVFCFVYIDDGFSELSEYVVFEIPTFLLFSGVILVICLFMRLSKKKFVDFCFFLFFLFIYFILFLEKCIFFLVFIFFFRGFDFKSQDMKLWILGILALVLVWSLFLIVTVVYSEVILEVNNFSFLFFYFHLGLIFFFFCEANRRIRMPRKSRKFKQ